jgi:AGCS family alanine or glycine:cation symporter
MASLLWQNIRKKKDIEGTATVESHKALFTAMSTVIGIGNMVAPVFAIKLGGPGALLGFFIVTIFGSATTFTEVTLAVKHRRKNPDESITGGPMPYLERVLPQFIINFFAYSGLICLMIYSGAQANVLADLLGSHNIPSYATGAFLAISITYLLIGGIQRIGNFSAKIIPLMFILYCGASFWIIFNNLHKLPHVLNLIFRSAFTPKAFFGAGTAYGEGFYTNEAGFGIGTYPHTMAETKSPLNQGILAMISSYSNGFMCVISGLVVLLTGTWLDPGLGIGINILAQSFALYFSHIGVVVLLFSSFLFAIGTILGNSYNGSQCLLYVTNRRGLNYYYIATALIIFFSCILEVEFVARASDFLLVPITIPNLIGILILIYKEKDLLKVDTAKILQEKNNF